jgi:hypothetical protein
VLHVGAGSRIAWQVDSADGAALALGNPLNRVRATVANPAIATLQGDGDDAGRVVAQRPGRTTLTLTYQRRLANGTYNDVYNLGRGRQPVAIRIPILVTR